MQGLDLNKIVVTILGFIMIFEGLYYWKWPTHILLSSHCVYSPLSSVRLFILYSILIQFTPAMHDVMDCQVEILQLIKPYRPLAIITLLLVFFTLKYPLSASVHVYGIILGAWV